MKYIDKLNDLIRSYFEILSPDFPEWLNEYIETDRMLKQQYVSVTCGKIYSKQFDYGEREIPSRREVLFVRHLHKVERYGMENERHL